jgi:hypothetical protein
MSQLEYHRQELNKFLNQWQPALLVNNWLPIGRAIDGWWNSYKQWEKQDTFDKAFQDDRMTVRSFPAGFEEQRAKEFPTLNIEADRYFADGQYTRLSDEERKKHAGIFNAPREIGEIQGKYLERVSEREEKIEAWDQKKLRLTKAISQTPQIPSMPESPVFPDDLVARYREAQKYHAKRGIDSSPFAVPSNFATREKKYEEGLHDLSASILNHNTPILDQVHNSGQGAHYSFLPLSEEEDQEVIFTLTRYAKDRVTFPQLYPKVRGFRAEMTRVKLAQDFDMAVGYSVIPVVKPPNESPGARPAFKLRYGLGNTTTVSGQNPDPLVTAQIYQARQQTARRFKQILLTRPGLKNEIVIAIRKHAGPFPVYAVLQGKVLKCYDIVGNEMKLNGKTISANGHLS